jgi:hypothetical protein
MKRPDIEALETALRNGTGSFNRNQAILDLTQYVRVLESALELACDDIGDYGRSAETYRDAAVKIRTSQAEQESQP